MANNIIRRVWNQNRMVNIEDLTGAAFQAEIGGHTFEISGIDDTGAVVELSGTVSGVFRRPDNADIPLTGSASDGVASVTLSEDCYAVPGRFGLTIFVTSDSHKVAVYACVGTVAVSSTGNVAGDTPANVEDLIDDINAAIADLNTAIGSIPADYSQFMAAIAPAYSSSALYAIGSYAWHDGTLYRCTTPITTAESWTAGHWTAAVLGDDVGDLKSAVDMLDGAALNNHLSKTFSQSVTVQNDYREANQVVLEEGKEYDIEIMLTDVAGGAWTSTSYPRAICIYLSRGAVGPNSQYVKRILTSQSTLTDYTYHFNFVATATDATATHLCVYVQLNPTGNFAGKIVVNSAYNIPDKIAEIEPLLYVNKPDSHGEWTQGTINSSDGNINVRSDRIVDITYYDSDEIDNVYVDSDYDLLYGLYTSDSINGFVSTSSWVKSVNAPFSQKYVRFAVRKAAGGDILPSEETGFTIVYKRKTIKSAIEDFEDFDDFNSPYTVGSVNQVARLGWKVYANDTPPEQSVASYALAYKNHARIMLCDVRVTANGKYICWHDADLGAELGTNTVRHEDGSELSDAEKAQLVSSLTLEQLNEYDYGLYKGAEYAGTKMLTLFDFIKWCALANCIPMLEIKVQLTSSQVSEIATVIKAVGLSDRVIIDDYQSHFANNLSDWLSELPNATICVIAGAAGYNTAITMCRTAIESGNKALITLSTTSQLSQIQDENGNLDMSKVALATDYGIGLSYTELTNDSALLEFYNGGYMDVFSYIACRTRLDNWIASKIGI